MYCGICHSDVFVGENKPDFPFVPGHEILGKVKEIGSKVTKVKVGDNIGVGVFVDSCLDCENCNDGDDQYCMKGIVKTYQDTKKYGRDGGNQDIKT